MVGYGGFLCTVDYVQIAYSDGQAGDLLRLLRAACFSALNSALGLQV